MDAFWNLSATIDVERLRSACDGLSTTMSGCHVELAATPVHGGGAPHTLSFGFAKEHHDLIARHADNVGVDAAGVAVGAKVGGPAGVPAGPVGMAAGTVIGASSAS